MTVSNNKSTEDWSVKDRMFSKITRMMLSELSTSTNIKKRILMF